MSRMLAMDQIVLNVEDMDTILDFYTNVLGLEPERLEEVPDDAVAERTGVGGPPRVGARRGSRRKVLPEQVGAELRRTAGSRAPRLEQRLHRPSQGARCHDRGRAGHALGSAWHGHVHLLL